MGWKCPQVLVPCEEILQMGSFVYQESTTSEGTESEQLERESPMDCALEGMSPGPYLFGKSVRTGRFIDAQPIYSERSSSSHFLAPSIGHLQMNKLPAIAPSHMEPADPQAKQQR